MNFFRRQLPAIAVFVVGITLVIQYYVPHPDSTKLLENANQWQRIIKNCALLLGVISLIGYHGRKIRRMQAGFGYSVVLIACFVTMVVAGLWKGVSAPRNIALSIEIPTGASLQAVEHNTDLDLYPEDTLVIEQSPLAGLRGFVQGEGKQSETLALEPGTPVRFGQRGKLVVIVAPRQELTEEMRIAAHIRGDTTWGYWMFQNIKVPMESTMFSLLGFFISSAAFRAFRARSVDATIMLAAAIFVMIGRISFGDMASDYLAQLLNLNILLFPHGTAWLMTVPAMSAMRAIQLGIYLSVIATSVRIIFGIERSYLGKGE